MKKSVKSNFVTLGIILVILLVAYFSLSKPKVQETDKEIIKCIGERSTLYVQLGCPHCKTQEELFGENIGLIKIIDCFYEKEKCLDIKGTPTWEIKDQKYTGVKSIEELKELTKC